MPDDLESIVAAVAADHPEPSPRAEEVIAKLTAPDGACGAAHDAACAAGPAAPTWPDRDGAKWDATRHAWPARFTTRGTWALRRKGDPPAPQTAATWVHRNALPEVSPAVAGGGDGVGGVPVAPCDVIGIAPADAAEIWSTRLFLTAQAMGPQWEPKPHEARDVRVQLERYFAANGSIDLPPGWALVLALGTYAAPRLLAMPAVQRVLANIFRRKAVDQVKVVETATDDQGDAAAPQMRAA